MQGFSPSPLPFKYTPPITLATFIDPQCPYSKRAFFSLQSVSEHYKDKLLLTFHFCALPIHYAAFLAVQGLRIVERDYGTDKMFQYLHLIFENQAQLQNSNTAAMTRHEIVTMLAEFAAEIGCDMERFRSGMTNWNYTKLALRDWQYAVSRGVSGTPKFFLNDFAVVGLDSNSKLVDWRKRLDPLMTEVRENSGDGAQIEENGGMEEHGRVQ
uniref:Thioredoxin-like fold domain-containing protein n=1 Tax=Percolomonas cosmopolitus TaxID=63605 RepID=A0A7S1KN83_9EUKA